MLRLLHFSDIHFNEEQGVTDDNIEVRDAIEKDLKYLMLINDISVEYILVCGDIAFSGKKEEYQKAKDWLYVVCEIVKCKSSSVLMVPGNHDVDRTIINKSFLQKIIHKNIKDQSNNDVDKTFADLTKNGHIDIIKVPQSNFNEFASIYACNVANNHLYWELKHAEFGEYQLIFRGCNTALLSDKDDDLLPDKMVMSKHQHYVKDDLKTIYITLCHHPVECMIDKENVENSFNKKVAIQLYGHNHQFHVEEKDKSLIIHAGAVKPDTNQDGYNPCYNIIDVDIEENEGTTSLFVRIWIREWNGSNFISGVDNGSMFKNYNIPLNANTNPWKQKAEMVKEDVPINEIIQTINKPIETDRDGDKYTERDLRYKFLTLPFRNRCRIGNEMINRSFEDGQMSQMARSLNFLNEIKKENRYNELWQKINF